jgi:pyruvate formate lyase activating enzyme
VLFTGGCNFRCPFCHNGGLVLGYQTMADIPFSHILDRLGKFRKWIDHVVITGGEPTIQKGLPEAIAMLKKRGLKVKLDTNGSHPQVLKALVEGNMIDYVAMDVKGPIEGYDRWCGVPVKKEQIRESIDFLLEGYVDYEFRMTLVPFLHKEHDAYRTAEEIGPAKRFFLQEFVPRDTLNPKYSAIRPFTSEKMKSIRESVRDILDNAPIRNHIH